MRAKPVRISLAKSSLISSHEPSSTISSMTAIMSKGLFSSAGMISSRRLPLGFGGARPARGGGRSLAVLGHEREVALREGDRLVLGLARARRRSRDTRAVHLGAAHLLERDLLADDHLGHARRAEVHARVAVDHHDDVAERGDVRAARGARAEEQADLRDLPAQLHLVVEDATRAAPAGEHLDLIGDARAGRVDQVEERHAEVRARSPGCAGSSRRCACPTSRPSRSSRWP